MALVRALCLNLCKPQKASIFFKPAPQILCAINVKLHPVEVTSEPVFNSLISWRFSHAFLSRLTADQLWKGVTSLSPAGRRKGRGRGGGRKVARDLNRGQVIGFGKKNMLWPGLNAPVVQGRELLRQQELPPDESREKRLLELRDKMATKKSFKIHPLDRGWTGSRLPGRSLGPPDAVGEDTFEGFDSRVLEFKPVMHMTAERGRFRRLSAMVCVGNKKGLAGFAVAKSVNGQSAAKAAKNKAAKNLRYIQLDNNSVMHDFFTQFGAVRIFVKKKPEGYGLCTHRVLRAICEMVGIKDLWAKVEGPTDNYQCLVKAFFIGLMRQKTPQLLAEEKGLHLVEMRKDRDYFPVVIASPSKCRTEKDFGPTELLDYTLHLHNNKVEAERKPFQPFYVNFHSYIKEMKDRERQRNQRDVRIHLLAKYGALKSFITIKKEEEAKQKLNEQVEE
ncbi:small ribosomal subunit protein uS5m [Parasteatoda tepidariorum]|uniref:small ribosomal subunit protein uS5m n=1 Tax=Parasteatoda tepidariorum TaxID=114398 RepID=UPI001C722351|nr:28S ribosomal protein S5, mitochondrial [Parasteatoda tepidariorum]